MYKKYLNIREHFKNGGKLVWNDPDPIEDNDYLVSYLEDIPEGDFDVLNPILIQYNEGLSEAQVFLHELLIVY